jgi:hypothetical protein
VKHRDAVIGVGLVLVIAVVVVVWLVEPGPQGGSADLFELAERIREQAK